ncbi:VWA domain-containing protein [Leptolyngbya sp. 7M]|uniref:VWA domain-containing protein n=1 Tax=Leptolyngbya sp. 7M TaxID=2812896 RepID=UPI001B8D490B|nr:VWA domain-containing protein [Leptolyngbya sp. 7M]QYO62387.1 VWA domain-containing protein [Leptolyngbya sp. 7M]
MATSAACAASYHFWQYRLTYYFTVMLRNLRSACLALFGLLILSLSADAQVASPTPPDEGGQIKTFEVRLPVTVTERKNTLVSGLTKADFIVLEDGVEQEITFFSDEKTNPPVFVGVLMDTSPSTAGKLRFSKEAAANFFYTVVQLRKDKGAFMTFDNEVKLHQDFTDKLDLLQYAWRKLQYLKKGSVVICTGSIEPNPYISSNGNVPKAGLEMTVLDVDLDIVRGNENEDEAGNVDSIESDSPKNAEASNETAGNPFALNA